MCSPGVQQAQEKQWLFDERLQVEIWQKPGGQISNLHFLESLSLYEIDDMRC